MPDTDLQPSSVALITSDYFREVASSTADRVIDALAHVRLGKRSFQLCVVTKSASRIALIIHGVVHVEIILITIVLEGVH